MSLGPEAEQNDTLIKKKRNLEIFVLFSTWPIYNKELWQCALCFGFSNFCPVEQCIALKNLAISVAARLADPKKRYFGHGEK